jgi:hypothetical protein
VLGAKIFLLLIFVLLKEIKPAAQVQVKII